jgi:hypothetical protein
MALHLAAKSQTRPWNWWYITLERLVLRWDFLTTQQQEKEENTWPDGVI